MTSVKIGQLFTLAYTKPLSASGAPQPFAQMFFYVSGSGFTTQQTVYADIALQNPLTQPITADANGRFAPVFMNPALQYGWQLIPVSGPTQQADPVNVQNTAIPVVAVKATTTSRSSTTTLTVDPELSYSIPAAGTYRVELDIQIGTTASGTTPGFSYEVSFSGTVNSSAGNTLAVAGVVNGGAITSAESSTTLNTPSTGIALGATGGHFTAQNILRIVGTIQLTSAGTLAFLWAQNISSATFIGVNQTSSMTVTRIG